MNEKVYDVVEVVTMMGYSVIGKLEDDNSNVVKLKEPLMALPAPQGITLKSVGSISYVQTAEIDKSNILGYVVIKDPVFIKKYNDTITELKAAASGLTMKSNKNSNNSLKLVK